MADGNLSRILLWVSDTVIAKKVLDQKYLYFVADAATGEPVPNASVEFYGWRSEPINPDPKIAQNRFRIVTKVFTEFTDKDGQIILGAKQLGDNYNWQWLATARTNPADEKSEARFAYMGFNHVWYQGRHDPEYNQDHTFVITDRPVYRPENTVHWKMWIQHAKYDEPDVSAFAGKTFTMRLFDPKGEKILEKQYTADEYGGIAGDYELAKGAALGVYGLQLVKLQ